MMMMMVIKIMRSMKIEMRVMRMQKIMKVKKRKIIKFYLKAKGIKVAEYDKVVGVVIQNVF